LPSSLDHQVQQTAVRLLDAFGLGELLDEALGFLLVHGGLRLIDPLREGGHDLLHLVFRDLAGLAIHGGLHAPLEFGEIHGGIVALQAAANLVADDIAGFLVRALGRRLGFLGRQERRDEETEDGAGDEELFHVVTFDLGAFAPLPTVGRGQKGRSHADAG